MKRRSFFPRTDLALERVEKSPDQTLPGVEKTVQDWGVLRRTRVRIETPEAAAMLEKPVGNYDTFEPADFKFPSQQPAEVAQALGRGIRELLPPEGLVLVVGLGNRQMTPDALGPLCAEKVLATRHLARELKQMSWVESLRPAAVLAPGVLGQTGIETAELLQAAVESLHPAAVLLVDALSGSSLLRLGKTVQLCDTGISPGSGVQNRRQEISSHTLGCPVLSAGVPMVASLATFREDLPAAMMVTPQEVDAVVRHAAETLALAINLALQPALSVEEIQGLTV